MAVLYLRKKGMTSDEFKGVSSTLSGSKEAQTLIPPDGSDPIDITGLLTNDDPRMIEVQKWEKAGLLSRIRSGELTGNIRDTTLKNGPAKEWNELEFSMSSQESRKILDLPESAQIEYFQAIQTQLIAAYAKTMPAGKIAAEFPQTVIIRDAHTDTGNIHITMFVHNHGFDSETKRVIESQSVAENSRFAYQTKEFNKELGKLNEDLRARYGVDIPKVDDVKLVNGTSLYAEHGVSDQAKHVINQSIVEAGGEPDQFIGAPGASQEELANALPGIEDEAVESIIRKAMLETSREQKALADKFVAQQQALNAVREKIVLSNKNEQLTKTVQTLEKDKEELSSKVLDLGFENEKLSSEVETLTDSLASERAASQAKDEEIAIKSQEIADLESQVSDKDETISHLTGRVEEVVKERDGLKMEVDTKNAQIAKATEVILEKDGEIGALKGEVKDLKARIDSTVASASSDENLSSKETAYLAQKTDLVAREIPTADIEKELDRAEARAMSSKDEVVAEQRVLAVAEQRNGPAEVHHAYSTAIDKADNKEPVEVDSSYIDTRYKGNGDTESIARWRLQNDAKFVEHRDAMLEKSDRQIELSRELGKRVETESKLVDSQRENLSLERDKLELMKKAGMDESKIREQQQKISQAGEQLEKREQALKDTQHAAKIIETDARLTKEQAKFDESSYRIAQLNRIAAMGNEGTRRDAQERIKKFEEQRDQSKQTIEKLRGEKEQIEASRKEAQSSKAEQKGVEQKSAPQDEKAEAKAVEQKPAGESSDKPDAAPEGGSNDTEFSDAQMSEDQASSAKKEAEANNKELKSQQDENNLSNKGPSSKQ